MGRYIGIDLGDTGIRAAILEGNRCLLLWEAKRVAEESLPDCLMLLRQKAEQHLKETVAGAAIAIPGWYDDVQRRTLLDACDQAGLKKIRLFSAAGAAALADYIQDPQENGEGKLVLILRLEKGLELALVDAGSGVVEVLDCRCDSSLSSESYRLRLAAALGHTFRQKYGIDIIRDTAAMALLRKAADNVIETLSHSEQVSVRLPELCGEQGLQVTVTRTQFQKMTSDLTARVWNHVSDLITRYWDKDRRIQRVVMDAWSGSLGALREILRYETENVEILRQEPQRDALLGVAIRAANMEGQDQPLLVDAFWRNITLEARIPVVEADRSIPHSCLLYRFRKNDKKYGTFTILSKTCDHNSELRRIRYVIRDIPAAEKDDPGIDVTADIGLNGLLTFRAVDVASNKSLTVEIAREETVDAPLIPREYIDPKADSGSVSCSQAGEEALVRKMLPTYDNLFRAMNQPTSDAAYKKGVELTMKELCRAFASMEVEFFGAAGETFDPGLHNAVVHIYDGSRGENEIVLVMEQGVRMRGKILRYATVQVAN